MPTISGTAKENIGVYSCVVGKVVDPTAADVTAGTLDVTFPEFAFLNGVIVQSVVTATGEVNTSDMLRTISGNTLTIADGSSYNFAETDTMYVIGFGIPAG
jgi:hypothetical protein